MIETLRVKQSCGNKIGALIIFLSKEFDTINHYVLLSILKTYGFKKILFRLLEAILHVSSAK